MIYKFIKYETSENCLTIKLNRPEVLNSFNSGMAGELQHALDSAIADENIRAIMITGEGRAFSAGQDLAEAIPKDEPPADLSELLKKNYNPIIRKIRQISKPVIAAVNGVAAGAGANLALACDIVLASEKASFIQAFVNIGLIPDSGGTYFLPRLVGFQQAAGLMMLGEKISAGEAEKIGLIYKTFDESEFSIESEKLLKKLSQMPTKAIGFIKEALNRSMSNNLEEQLRLEEKLQAEAGSTFDYKEGVNAFSEKRKPEFKGE